MLCELSIENVAVIEKATVCFTGGLNVLTGETGAGKSIMIDSINAILGNRTSKDIVRNGTDKAVIWAVFENIAPLAVVALENAGYTNEEQLILQREISVDGKSICRINGRVASATVLREICAKIINIHGQHDNQSLLDSTQHINILDSFAKNEKIINEYKTNFRVLAALEKQIKTLSMNETEKEKRIELLTFQVKEIKSAKLLANEEETLNERKNIILHSQKILEGLEIAYNCINGGEGAAIDLLTNGSGALQEIRDFSEVLSPLSDKFDDIFYQLQELGIEIKSSLDDYEFDKNEIEIIEERLDVIYKLKKKYGCNIDEILVYLQNAQNELNTINSTEEQLDNLLEERDTLYGKVKKLANDVTQSRKNAFTILSDEITKSLDFLNMPNISFSLKHQTGTLTINGQDTLEFYIVTNAGEAPKPLAKIASGGELSRIMLAIKSALTEADAIDTVIYDEIDTGLSGMAAGRIGQTLKKTSKGRQVLCVTHTAQVAACADTHLLIRKDVVNGRTFTAIKTLQDEERASEIARIISGDNITPLSIASAKEMLKLMS